MRTIRFCSLSVTMPSTQYHSSVANRAGTVIVTDWVTRFHWCFPCCSWSLRRMRQNHMSWVDQLRLVSEPAAYSLILRWWWSWAPAAMHLYVVLATASIYLHIYAMLYLFSLADLRSNKSSLSLTELAFECRRLLLNIGCWFGRLSSSHGWLDGLSPYPSHGLWPQYLLSTKQSDLIALILFFAGTIEFHIMKTVGQSGVCLPLKQDLNNDCGLAEWYASLQYLHQKINITAGATSLNVDQSAVFCTTFPCFPRSQPTDDDPPRGHS